MLNMTRKTKKAARINLRDTQPQKEAFRQIWVPLVDHRDIPDIADAIKAAHPGTPAETIPDVAHFCFEAGRKALGLQGA
jgi:hypothetical protein